MASIEFNHVSKAYGEYKVLDDISIDIKEGELLVVLGLSGSGKTTFLRMINKLVDYDCGEIKINHQDIKQLDSIKLRKKIGYVIQGNLLFPHMNVYENIAYVPKLLHYDQQEIDQLVTHWLDVVGLDASYQTRMPQMLSGGQQQRIGIARALAANPEILLMDEPFSALDSITRMQLQDELLKLHHDNHLTTIFITHDIKEALKLGTKIMVLNNGKIEQIATSQEIINHPKTDFVKQLISTL